MKICTTKIELNRVHTCVVLCTCKIFKLLYVDMEGFINGSFPFQINQIIFLQSSLAQLLRDYIYALTEWSRSGGDKSLSAEDALNKAKSTIEEMITITTQVNILLKCYDLWLFIYWLAVQEWYLNINTLNIILKINDMRLLASAYMRKGNIYLGDEVAVKVTFTVVVTKYLEPCSCRSADLWHCSIFSGTMKPWGSQPNTWVRSTSYAVVYITIPDFIMKGEENYKRLMKTTNEVTWYTKRYFEYRSMLTFTLNY